MSYHTLLFFLTAGLAVAAVMAGSALASVVMLALGSVGVSLILFDFQAPWAAAFELSVCAGLLTALLAGAAVLVNRRGDGEDGENRARFYAMPLVMAAVAIAAWLYAVPFFESLESWARPAGRANALGPLIWDARSFDLTGQILVMAACVFAVKLILPRTGNRG